MSLTKKLCKNPTNGLNTLHSCHFFLTKLNPTLFTSQSSFSSPFAYTLLLGMAHFCHLLISGIVRNWWQYCVAHQAHACVHESSCISTGYKKNRDTLIKTLLHSATSGQKLHGVPLKQLTE